MNEEMIKYEVPWCCESNECTNYITEYFCDAARERFLVLRWGYLTSLAVLRGHIYRREVEICYDSCYERGWGCHSGLNKNIQEFLLFFSPRFQNN